jgi:hypothetical protein
VDFKSHLHSSAAAKIDEPKARIVVMALINLSIINSYLGKKKP